jgi:hypothetical protein
LINSQITKNITKYGPTTPEGQQEYHSAAGLNRRPTLDGQATAEAQKQILPILKNGGGGSHSNSELKQY